MELVILKNLNFFLSVPQTDSFYRATIDTTPVECQPELVEGGAK